MIKNINLKYDTKTSLYVTKASNLSHTIDASKTQIKSAKSVFAEFNIVVDHEGEYAAALMVATPDGGRISISCGSASVSMDLKKTVHLNKV